MRAVRKPDRGRAARDLLHRDDVREVAHRRAAVLFLDRDAEQAEGAELAPQVGGELVRLVDLRRARRDLFAAKSRTDSRSMSIVSPCSN